MKTAHGGHGAAHGHKHDEGHGHGTFHKSAHTHGNTAAGADIIGSARGIWCLKWSFAILALTSIAQLAVVLATGSVSLLADTVHNISDAATAVPLGLAFALGRLRPSRRFTYGLGRAEDFAGLLIIGIILSSAIYAGYQSALRFFHPQLVTNVWAVAAAALLGFIGNEAVAKMRISTGKEIGSAALVADGMHARADGFTSLAVLLGAAGMWLGFPLADPIAGIAISATILFVVWDSCKSIFVRLLDGVDPETIDDIRSAASGIPGALHSTEIRARWIGHALHAEVNIAVETGTSVGNAHDIATHVKHELTGKIKHLGSVVVHIDPENASGESFHSNARLHSITETPAMAQCCI